MSRRPPAPVQPAQRRRTPASLVLCLVALAVLTWADLASKSWAVSALSRTPSAPASGVCERDAATGGKHMQRTPTAPTVLVPGYLELRYAENCGAAFSMLDDAPSWVRLAIFAPAALAFTFGLLWLYATGYGARLFAVGVPLIASGALGNLIDRFRFGYVVDFIRFHVASEWAWPTFTVADVTIAIGGALLVLEGLRSARRSELAKKREPESVML